MDPITMFDTAATHAAQLARGVRPEQRSLPTPCSEWDVAALLEHMAGGPAYLLGALEVDSATLEPWPDQTVVQTCVAALRETGALERRCLSPANFEWSVAEAAAGTAMDQLIHAWDLAVAIGADRTVDPQVAEAIVEMFIPHMPELGRQAGFVGPEIPVPSDGTAADRLLGAMGRDPWR